MKFNTGFDLKHLRGDLFGGITAGIVALPLALAFGAQTELGAIAGLYGAIALGFFAALFGGTPVQISGPTAPMTVVSAVIIAESTQRAGSLQEAIPLVLAVFFVAGLLQVLMGVFRIGKYIRYIPYPVVSGFMSGIGVIIIIGQIFPLFGAMTPTGGSLAVLKSLDDLPRVIDWEAVVLSIIAVVLVYFSPRIIKAVPSTLIALLGVSLLGYLVFRGEVGLISDSSGGKMPSGVPTLHLHFFAPLLVPANWKLILEYAATLAALGAIDTLLTSVVADNITKTKHDSNQELVGQGIGNMAAAFIAGLPGAGATMRTVINANSGGKTRLSGIVAALLLLAILLGMGPLVGQVPTAVLAGILLTVGIGIIDYKGIRNIRAIPRSDAIIMMAVLVLTVFVGLLEAVAIGMLLASILFMKAISDVVEHRTVSAPLTSYSSEIPWNDEIGLLEKVGSKVYIKHLDGPLFFGFASRFQEMSKVMPGVKVVVFRMKKVPYIDQSGMLAMEEAVLDLQRQGITVAMTGLQQQPKAMLEGIKLIPNILPNHLVFKNFDACADWLREFCTAETA
ncbi:MAG: SulP family inorganic anion transporter [Saprospiraceae bacterium]|nr:SulP family inorganic anion transporter [Saprospiraceae bacterium]HRD80579.1 SulP family inorganic anion transporter [Saprospiraceae bacterium]HRF37533.1 SulP family inorganic anion transporter [Saprospiraceae bacterium]HRJ14780.1 SulP family inorganic anion transporter [Saprospiraceae bacterium]HRK80772.1 SulP family inorganic anion transporter [Saprospiraceae bacterium]